MIHDRLTYLEVIETFWETAKSLLPAKKRDLEELEMKRCRVIDEYSRHPDHPDLEIILILFDDSSGYNQLQKEIATMTRIAGIGGRKHRGEIGMMIMPLEEVKAIPILDVVEFRKIKKTGKRVMVSCPLHDDSSPSMVINTNNTFKCFSCGKGGTVIDLIMALYGLMFIDAVKHLHGFLKSKNPLKEAKESKDSKED